MAEGRGFRYQKRRAAVAVKDSYAATAASITDAASVRLAMLRSLSYAAQAGLVLSCQPESGRVAGPARICPALGAADFVRIPENLL